METYQIITSTEKAIKVKYPYYIKTSEYNKKHTQKYVEQWVPKSVQNIESWIKSKMTERGFQMQFIEMGIAPIKVETTPLVMRDEEKAKEKWDEFYSKVFQLTGARPHHRSGFDADGAYWVVNGTIYDFQAEYEELLKYNPTKEIKRYI